MRTTALHLIAFAVLLCPAQVAPAEDPPPEYQLKAAFVFNFVQYTQWPDKAFADQNDRKAPIVVAVLGDNPFGTALERIVAGRAVDGREISVRYAKNPADAAAAHVVFVARSEAQKLPQILKTLDGVPVLTVGDTDQFAALGGCIRLFTEDNKLRFEVNPDAVRRAGLQLSAKLLKLAKIRQENP